MCRMFRKPIYVLDEKSNKQLCDSESCSRFTLKNVAPGSSLGHRQTRGGVISVNWIPTLH
jgi:hypothetical protein